MNGFSHSSANQVEPFLIPDSLREWIHTKLCQRGDLDCSTPMWETSIRRNGIRCGIEFTMLAPRQVRLSAIWVFGENRVLFYDPDSKRFSVEPVPAIASL
jgi:hypothetical protein